MRPVQVFGDPQHSSPQSRKPLSRRSPPHMPKSMQALHPIPH
jgi:hypothetical protein